MDNKEVLESFVQLAEYLLSERKHIHLEPLQARDTIRAIKELQEENTDLKLKLAGAEESSRIRDKQLTEAWSQIEKLKCCGNCKYVSHCENNLDEEYSCCEYWELVK